MVARLSTSQFIRRQNLTRAALFHPSLRGDLLEQLWTLPAALVRTGNFIQSTNQRRAMLVNWGSQKFVLKHYRPRYWHLVRQLPFRSPAAATFNATLRLINAGLRTPLPLACVENRWGSLRRDSFLLYEYVEGETLRSYLERVTEHQRAVTEHLLNQVDDVWQTLARSQASLFDPHIGNFIVSPAGQLWVIDLDKARFHRTIVKASPEQERARQKFERSVVTYGSPFAVRTLQLVA